MPDMAGRTEVLLKLLPSSREELSKMSRGKRTQLEIILRSLETPGMIKNLKKNSKSKANLLFFL